MQTRQSLGLAMWSTAMLQSRLPGGPHWDLVVHSTNSSLTGGATQGGAISAPRSSDVVDLGGH
jgi:hypothetical protein